MGGFNTNNCKINFNANAIYQSLDSIDNSHGDNFINASIWNRFAREVGCGRVKWGKTENQAKTSINRLLQNCKQEVLNKITKFFGWESNDAVISNLNESTKLLEDVANNRNLIQGNIEDITESGIKYKKAALGDGRYIQVQYDNNGRISNIHVSNIAGNRTNGQDLTEIDLHRSGIEASADYEPNRDASKLGYTNEYQIKITSEDYNFEKYQKLAEKIFSDTAPAPTANEGEVTPARTVSINNATLTNVYNMFQGNGDLSQDSNLKEILPMLTNPANIAVYTNKDNKHTLKLNNGTSIDIEYNDQCGEGNNGYDVIVKYPNDNENHKYFIPDNKYKQTFEKILQDIENAQAEKKPIQRNTSKLLANDPLFNDLAKLLYSAQYKDKAKNPAIKVSTAQSSTNNLNSKLPITIEFKNGEKLEVTSFEDNVYYCKLTRGRNKYTYYAIDAKEYGADFVSTLKNILQAQNHEN